VADPAGHAANANMPVLILGALGVVYGDIGTSPLYAFREALHAAGGAPNENEVLGLLSLIVWALEREGGVPYEALTIFAIVIANAALGFVQEARAEAAVASLKQMSAAMATVVRGGQRQVVPAAEVVPGDLVVIEEGATVPADARLVANASLQTAEAGAFGDFRESFDLDLMARASTGWEQLREAITGTFQGLEAGLTNIIANIMGGIVDNVGVEIQEGSGRPAGRILAGKIDRAGVKLAQAQHHVDDLDDDVTGIGQGHNGDGGVRMRELHGIGDEVVKHLRHAYGIDPCFRKFGR
jgi:hypothetical protein